MSLFGHVVGPRGAAFICKGYGGTRGIDSSDFGHTWTKTNINDGEWHHLAFVRDTSSWAVKIYLDGVYDNWEMERGTGEVNHNGDLIIGAGKDGGVNMFRGSIDEAFIYNRALSDTEIEDLYNDALPPPPPPMGLVINKVKIPMEDGEIEIEGYFTDMTDPTFDNLINDPQIRIRLELQTVVTSTDPEFGIVGEDQVPLTSDGTILLYEIP
jgi:hypothetical protein